MIIFFKKRRTIFKATFSNKNVNWEFHLRSLPKVWRTQMIPGTKQESLLTLLMCLFLRFKCFFFCLLWKLTGLKIQLKVSITLSKSKLILILSTRNKLRKESGIVKTIWRCLIFISLDLELITLVLTYLLPREEQNPHF